MAWLKNFLKPNWWKVVLMFLVLLFGFFYVVISIIPDGRTTILGYFNCRYLSPLANPPPAIRCSLSIFEAIFGFFNNIWIIFLLVYAFTAFIILFGSPASINPILNTIMDIGISLIYSYLLACLIYFTFTKAKRLFLSK